MGDVTQMLISYGQGDRAVLDALLPLVYDELRVIARSYLRQERADHTLQPTGLVHEAYLRLINQQRVDWRNRAQFFGLAASMMRRILVNHAESKRAEKRGGGIQKVSLDEVVLAFDDGVLDLLALDEVLRRLEKFDKIKSDIVELKFFSPGLARFAATLGSGMNDINPDGVVSDPLRPDTQPIFRLTHQ